MSSFGFASAGIVWLIWVIEEPSGLEAFEAHHPLSQPLIGLACILLPLEYGEMPSRLSVILGGMWDVGAGGLYRLRTA